MWAATFALFLKARKFDIGKEKNVQADMIQDNKDFDANQLRKILEFKWLNKVLRHYHHGHHGVDKEDFNDNGTNPSGAWIHGFPSALPYGFESFRFSPVLKSSIESEMSGREWWKGSFDLLFLFPDI